MLNLILEKRQIIFVIIIMASSCFLGCVSSSPNIDPNAEKWIGELTGPANGNLEFYITKTGENTDLYSVKGFFILHLKSTGGYGKAVAKGNIKGVVKNGVINARLSGYIRADMGSSPLSGEITGDFTTVKAKGTWMMSHREDAVSGEWTAKKSAS